MFENQARGHRSFLFGASGQIFKLGWGHRTKLKDISKTEGGTPHIPIEVIR